MKKATSVLEKDSVFIKKEKSKQYSYTCIECKEEVEIYICQNTKDPNGRVYYETVLCSCQKAKQKAEQEAEIKEKKERFSRKCRKYFDFIQCDLEIENHIFENFEVNKENKQAFEEAKKATFGYFSKYGLNFIGQYGSGKTRLLKTMGYELYKKGEDCIFVEYARIFDRIFKTYNNKENPEKDSDLLDCLMNVKNLFIDELGVGTNSPAKEDLFLKIINARSKKGLRTHFSMNPEGEGNLSPRISSRLVEYAKPVLNDAPDYRPKVLAKNIELEEKVLRKSSKA